MAKKKSSFVEIHHRYLKNGSVEVYPKFINYTTDKRLLIHNHDILAFYDEDSGLWIKGDDAVISYIDDKMSEYVKTILKDESRPIHILWMWDCDSGSIDKWRKYCGKQARDNYDPNVKALDDKLIFSNQETTLEDYVTKKLPYPLVNCDIPAYNKLMSTWYGDGEERQKLEWSIGAVITGDAKHIQKFIVLYGDKGSGKSSFFKILQKLFQGFVTAFNASEMASKSASFPLESFSNNPLVAIQHDGNLSKIEDNTLLNSVTSHETVLMNVKFEKKYPTRIKAMLYMGTNSPVKITDAKSGILRRLIDVYPTGNTVPYADYVELMNQVDFELGGIAWHCKEVYEKLGEDYYHDYIPTEMMAQTNDFYDFVEYYYEEFKDKDQITAVDAYVLYDKYAEFANLGHGKKSYNAFKQELKNYFRRFYADTHDSSGNHVRSLYSGFLADKFKNKQKEEAFFRRAMSEDWLIFTEQHSLLDDEFSEFPAQYHDEKENRPYFKWANVKTKLKDLDTHKLHWVMPEERYIFIDFDKKNEKGEKDVDLNIEAVRKSGLPKTYAELSKSGGVHLHYIYAGDPSELSCLLEPNVEIKTCKTSPALRRKLTKCNNIPITMITGGLPKKEGGKPKVVDDIFFKNNDTLRKRIIEEMLTKPVSTTNSVSLIKKWLDDAYEREGFKYDVRDLKDDISWFALNSHNQSDHCEDMVSKMHFASKDVEEELDRVYKEQPVKDTKLVFFDIEVYPNLLLLVWKYKGVDNYVTLINPSPEEVKRFIKTHRIIGFNNIKYDNVILTARTYGYSIEACYNLSRRIIGNDSTASVAGSKQASYTDIFDFAAAPNKMSLKKYEIKLGLPHMEMNIPWDKPVPDDMLDKVIEYCKNDVYATEKVFEYLSPDYKARLMLANMAGMTPNDSTNSLTARFIFGDNRNPQVDFNYPDLSKEFPGYIFKDGKSSYMGEDPKEGGYVYAEPGVYYNVALLDVASMHPSSIIAMNLFGPYTDRFADIVKARLLIKHKEYETARTILDGQLAPYLENDSDAKEVAGALKTAINAVYGQTFTSYKNPFRDPKNKDNVVAKRGALFMINLKHEVQARFFTVAHIKTDSIKIPNATPEIIKFVMDYGKHYGYSFEHEATYDRMCLVNDSVYIAKYATPERCEELYGYIPGDNKEKGGQWTPTGAQFQHPYIFKSLFSKEQLCFDDYCEVKSVSTALYLDFNENMPDVSQWELLKTVRKKASLGIDIRKKDHALIEQFSTMSNEELDSQIAKGHNYVFVGRVGQFTPVLEGHGGGILLREGNDGYSAAPGTKGYRWVESEVLKNRPNWVEAIDISYFRKLCDDAIDTINKYADFQEFVSGEGDPFFETTPKHNFMNIPEDAPEELPFN